MTRIYNDTLISVIRIMEGWDDRWQERKTALQIRMSACSSVLRRHTCQPRALRQVICMFAAGLVIFLKNGRVIAVPFLKLHPSVATSLIIELHLLDALTRDLGAVLEQYKH